MNRAKIKLDHATRSELAHAYMALQEKYEKQGIIPKKQKTLLTRDQALVEKLGAVHLGLLVAAITILFNYILVNLLLHLPPS